jgi:diguanylate cyclase (GGDEF)-like protein
VTGSDDETALSRTFASTATLKLASLHALDPFYTPLEERFERITRLARRALDVPIAAITVVQGDRQWFKSVAGLQVAELPMSRSLCGEVVREGRQVIVPDTRDDLYLMNNPLVCGTPGIRFYAGFPLRDSERRTIGTFCAMALEPRQPDAAFERALCDLGAMAQNELFSIELSNAQSALVSKLGQARRQAMFDPLTRLWNRRGATELLQAALREAKKLDRTVGICLADVDNFKQVNDRYGHQAGDQVLRRVAGLIVASVRPQDIVCRYGGEEFLVIVNDIDEKGCAALAERICEGLREVPIGIRGGTIAATISVGVALRSRGENISAERLIQCADEALYRSKRSGRDRVSVSKD